MRVLLIGGGGQVGHTVTPHLLAAGHAVRVLDRASPRPAVAGRRLAEFVQGDATDTAALDRACAGVEAVVHLAAVVPRGPEAGDAGRIAAAYAVNIGSVHAALLAARRHDVPAFVHISTMSVYAAFGERLVDPAVDLPDAGQPYGLSKRLAEEVCRTAARDGATTVTSLRLAFPTPDEDWPLWRPPDGRPAVRLDLAGTAFPALAACDAATAILAAARRRGAYRAFAITGDRRGVCVRDDGTAAALGWTPLRDA
ncbi:NAD(P)-dependent oxidoreductase [Nonomuraea sp. NPDC046802]|uniref:NAD-dependent epimerase/dehydratase family protein n=1 Tax=Nonomuraea sp. NPDC046802 TaxID=3154919 RepID=UPI0033CD0EB1